MATEKQNAANKRNSRKSTGPRTRAGKAAAARNAISHGLTMPPPSADVLRWLKIISGDPEVCIEGLGKGEKADAVLALARAEAQLERTRSAVRAAEAELFRYTKSHNEPDPLKLDPDDLDDPAVLKMLLRGEDVGIEKTALRLLIAATEKSLPRLRKKLRVLERYERAAERDRQRAFSAWIA